MKATLTVEDLPDGMVYVTVEFVPPPAPGDQMTFAQEIVSSLYRSLEEIVHTEIDTSKAAKS